jgi:VanZ family protein
MAGTLMLGWPGMGRIALAWALAVAFEVAQLGIVGRHFSGADLLANLTGAAWGSGLAAAHAGLIPKRLR